MAAMEGTKIKGGRIRSLEILFRFGRGRTRRELATDRFAVAMNEGGSTNPKVRASLEARQAEAELRLPVQSYLLEASDSFAACTRALAKLSTFLSTIKAVTASFSAC